MNNSWNDELISAYLDGELTADEQAQVEQALASDARLRQMHDDLRALRQSLQAMPRLTLGDAFTARVLQAAQQAKAAQQAPPAAVATTPVAAAAATDPLSAAAEADPAHHHLAVVPAHPNEPTAWHVLVWSVAGMAAALCLVLLWPQPMADMAFKMKSGIVSDPTPEAASNRFSEQAEMARDSSLAPHDATKAMEAPQAEAVQMRMAAPAPGSADAPAMPVEESLQEQSGTKQAGADNRLRALPGGPREVEMQRNRYVEQQEKRAASRADTAPATLGDATDFGNRGMQRAPSPAAGQRPKALLRKSGADLPESLTAEPTAELQIVRLGVPVEVLRQRHIDARLAENGIALAEPENSGMAGKKAEAVGALRQQAAEAPADADGSINQFGSKTALADSLGELAADDWARVAQQATGSEGDLILLEATPEKLAKVLADLQTQAGVTVSWGDQAVDRATIAGTEAADKAIGGFGGAGGAAKPNAAAVANSPAPAPPAPAEAAAPRFDMPAGSPAPAPAVATKPAGPGARSEARTMMAPALAPQSRAADNRALKADEQTADIARRVPWQEVQRQQGLEKRNGDAGATRANDTEATAATTDAKERKTQQPVAGEPIPEAAKDASFSATASGLANADEVRTGAKQSAPKRVRVLLLIQATPPAAPSKAAIEK